MAISIDTLRSLDANARFETLDGTSKKKAAIVIGVLGQESEKAVINGCGYALDPRGDSSALSFVGDERNDKKIYKLEFNSGQLNVNLKIEEQRKGILNKGDLMESKNGLTVNAGRWRPTA